MFLMIVYCFKQVDIPLSIPFYKWLLGKESHLALSDMDHIDPTLARSLLDMEAIARKKSQLEVCSFYQ